MRGQFKLWLPSGLLVLPNNVLDEGEESFLKMIVQASVADVAAGGNFYVGMCGLTFAESTTLATLVGEPTVTNGYARKAVTRNATDWPTVDLVGGVRRAATGILTFTASGGNFSVGFSRLFLCNVASGSAGKLFSVSGALPSPIIVTPTTPLPVTYELYLR